MRTKEQIDEKLNQLIEKMQQSARLSAGEKLETRTLINELKEEIISEKTHCENELSILSLAELNTQIDLSGGVVVKFRPRITIED